jgi:NAD(P)-dependent dehydrogenase (short-subunit alcohol dehydrogenase family)
MRQNITSAAAAAAISSKLLQSNGLLVLTGSTAALSPSPSMIAYSTSKAALHYMVQSVSQDASSFAKDVRVIGLLPTSIDTENNRRPAGGGGGRWTTPDEIAKLVMMMVVVVMVMVLVMIIIIMTMMICSIITTTL